MMGCRCGFTRRDLLLGAGLDAQAKKGMRIDIHAHLWTDEYLDLTQSYGNTDTGTQRNKGAGLGKEEMDKRFALMEANGVEMQVLSICPQSPHFDNKEHAVNAARKANDLYAEVVNRWPTKFKAFAAVPLPHVDEALVAQPFARLPKIGVRYDANFSKIPAHRGHCLGYVLRRVQLHR